ncbi:hypothetical protein [Paracraurococcus lichenis]|uniref:Lipoprotein n=1 Tax=Paracraurococcus lichenis TaxID=3064888 RepID=A0ABT9DX88_9PROT|nr:hypothetical protein [Paracraurococcus sp. LOR1-02]MDO9708520.1 hypothetical protein [Paracraurococcus sp. LOR1-02]
MQGMSRRAALAALAALSACAPTAEQQAAALTPSAAATAVRARESRRFDTGDRTLLLQSVIGVLQDLGYSIEESQAQQGVVVASRIAGGRVRAQVVLRPAADRGATIVRATFQRVVPRPGAMLAYGETLDDPAIYQGFFEKLAQSLFLTAHEI